jgi:hypothetical protein
MAKANKSLARAIKKSEKAKKPQPVIHKDKAIVKSAYDAAFMEEMSKSFVVTPEQQNKQAIESWLAAKRATPAKEAVMFNMDLLRHVGKFIPTPLKDAVAFAKERQDNSTYEYFEPGMTESKRIDFYQTILQIIVSLKEKQEKIPIYSGFTVVPMISYYDEINQDVFDDLYEFLDKLKISQLFDFNSWYYMELDEVEQIFSSVDEEVEHALEYFNEEGDDDDEILTAEDLHAGVPMIRIEDITDEEFFQRTLHEKPMFNPTYTFDVVTARVESRRPVTEQWLKQLAKQPQNLFMRPDETETPAEFKYRIAVEKGYKIYIESDLQICKDMLKLILKEN